MEPAATGSPSGGGGRWARIAALLEVTGVFVAGNVAASLLGPWLGIGSLGPRFESALKASDPDLVPLTWALLAALGVQYACLLPLAFSIGWWHRRRRLPSYGLTTAGQSLPRLVAFGLLGFCLVALPFKVLWVVQQHVDLGPGSFLWAFIPKRWNPSFWLFFAAVSFVVPPLVEEVFYRGYCQGRLEEDFGGTNALLIAALFFIFAHGQYHRASFLNAATIICLVPLALGLGYVYLRTRSLVPGIVLHAAVNVPTKGIYDYAVPAAMVAVAIVTRRHWLPAVQDLCSRLRGMDVPATVGAAACAVAVAVGFQTWPNGLIPAGLSGLIAALFLETRERRLGRSGVPRENSDITI